MGFLSNIFNKEIWKVIIGTGGNFEVSDHGRIRNKDYVSPKGSRIKAKIKKMSADRDGYLNVNISINGVVKQRLVHRLVAKAFIPNPDKLPMVLHGDDKPGHNLVKNLRWGSAKDNMDDKVRRGRSAKGENHGMSKLTEKEVIAIKKMISSGVHTQKNLAKKFNVSIETISRIKLGKGWTHVK